MFNSYFCCFLFTCLSVLLTTINATCPDGCTCLSKSVVCTCYDSTYDSIGPQMRDLRLTGFGSHLDYLDLFVVHSCDKVTLANDTFSGVELVEQMKFLSIKVIEIEPYAFRGIRTSPKQLIIEDSGFDVIPENAFVGLTHVDHFWFKHVTIKRIEKRAFAQISHFNYVYFREATIESIDSQAFGDMRDINYFYMRGGVNIGFIDDYVFKDSHIDEIMFENANVTATDFTLSGLFVKKLELVESKWHTNKVLKRVPVKQRISQFVATNSTFNRLVLGLFYDTGTIEINNCQIHHLASISGFSSKNIDQIGIRNSRIHQWHSHAIAEGSVIHSIVLENCQIDKLHSRSIFDAVVDTITVDKCQISHTAPKMLEKSTFKKILLTESQIGLFLANSFASSKIDILLINEVKFDRIEHRAFASINADQIQISGSTFPEFPQHLFDNTNVTDLTILSTQFRGPATRYVFSGLYAKTLRFTHCEIACQPDDCEVNSLFFHSSIHHLSWTFEYNRCISPTSQSTIPASLICNNSTEIVHESGLLCRRRVEVEECICGNDNDIAVVPRTQAAIMTVGDCPAVMLIENNSPQLHSIYLYRVAAVVVHAVPGSLRKFSVLHSTIRFEKPFILLNSFIDSIQFNGVNVEHVAEKAFADSYINQLVFNHSRIAGVTETAFSNSVINWMDMQSTEVVEPGNLFKHVKAAVVSHSRLRNSEDVSLISPICYKNNSIECRCPEMSHHLEHNTCDNNSNQCINGTTSEYWRKTRNIYSNKACPNAIELRVNNNSAFSSNLLSMSTPLSILIGKMVLSFMCF